MTDQQPHTAAAPDTVAAVEELQVLIGQTLTDLTANLHLVQLLTDSRHRILFQAPGAREASAEAMRKERRERTEATSLQQRIGWMRREALLAGTGQVVAPGNLSGIAVDATTYLELRHLVRRGVRALAMAGICTLDRLPAEPTVFDLLAHLRRLTWLIPAPDALAEIWTGLRDLNASAERLVDGEAVIELRDPCPHCGGRTLVVSFKDDLITCGRNRRTNHYDRCICPDPLCECKQRPYSFRHTWTRTAAPKSRNSWDHLSALFTRARQAKEPKK